MTLLTETVGASGDLFVQLAVVLMNLLALLPAALLTAALWALHALHIVAARILLVAVWPITAVVALALVVLAPVLYTLSYIIAPAFWVVSIVPKLETLYIYLGSAAFVGVLAGLSLKLVATAIATILRLHDGAQATTASSSPARSHTDAGDSPTQTFKGLLEDTTTSSQDDDWTWLTNFGSHRSRSDAVNPKPNIKAKRKAHALLSETIVEESSSG